MSEKDKKESEGQNKPSGSESGLKDGLSCMHLRADNSCNFSEEGCNAWADWHNRHRKDEPIDHFCILPVKERDAFNA
jgi:hypothetical protein